MQAACLGFYTQLYYISLHAFCKKTGHCDLCFGYPIGPSKLILTSYQHHILAGFAGAAFCSFCL